jgi:hypothetical protein
LRKKEDEPPRAVVGSIPCPPRAVVGSIPCPLREERWRKPNEEENLKVYTRRQLVSQERWRKPNEE